MKCPNCQCEMGSNVGICQYCGFDVGKYYGFTIQRRPEAEKSYEWAYWEEKRANDRYRRIINNTLLAGILVLNVLEILLLLFAVRT